MGRRGRYFIVRGICDDCDKNKNDVWQPYAAVVAAAYTRALLETMAEARINCAGGFKCCSLDGR